MFTRRRWTKSGHRAIAHLLTIGTVIAASVPSAAQITPDDTLGAENSILTPDGEVQGALADVIEGGAVRDANLFHSFLDFNVSEGQRVYFASPGAIANIFSRVTGSTPSTILGTLGVDGAANLFFLNPNGIIFGPNASLDIDGSFLGTTADAIQFGERGLFNALRPEVPNSRLTVHPSALLFNQIEPGKIELFSRASAGPDPSNTFNTFGLRVADRQSLLLVGGEILVDGGGLVALGGRLELGSVSGVGRVALRNQRGQLGIRFPDSVLRDDITLTNNAGLIVSSGNDGDISFFARHLNVLNQSTVEAGIGPNVGSLGSQAGDVTIDATATVAIRQASRIQNFVNSNGVGRSGNLTLRANRLIIQSNSGNTPTSTNLLVGINANAQGESGDLRIDADRIRVSGPSARLFTLTRGIGDSGNLTIHARHVRVDSGAQISASTFGVGNSGDLILRATDSIQLRGNVNDSPSGLFALVNPNSEGNGGGLEVFASHLLISDGAEISTSTFSAGDAGNLAIQVSDQLLIDSSSISALVTQNALGRGGDIDIQAQDVMLSNHARISSESLGEGRSGNVRLSELSRLHLQDSSIATRAQIAAGGLIAIQSEELLSFGSSDITTNVAIGADDGGQIQIDTNIVELYDDSDIQTNVIEGTGNGGTITIRADSIITFDDSDIVASAPQGIGGDINLVTPAYFGDSFSPDSLNADPTRLDGNSRTDINATGITSGAVSLPDVSFIQNSLSNLSEQLVDTETLIANSCIALAGDGSTFLVTGAGGLPYRPGDRPVSGFPTGEVRGVRDERPDQPSPQAWQIGDPIREPDGLYRLPDGRLMMSHFCDGNME